MTDLVTEGIAAAQRRVWYATCQTALLPTRSGDLTREPMARTTIARSTRIVCLVCGMAAEECAPGHALCATCGADIPASRARLDAREHGFSAQALAASAELATALEALSEAERGVWDRWQAAKLATTRVGRWANTADPALAQRVATMQVILDNPADARVSADFRRAATLQEYAYWMNAGAAEQARQVGVARAALDEWEEATR